MRSIKPGRGPSWGGVIGGIFAAIFGCIWIGMASSMGAPAFFPAFGVVFVLCAIGGVIYNLYNATSRNRLSDWDITEDGEERDPLQPPRAAERFCSACGNGLSAQFKFCPKCGQPIAP